ncbi:hypothetical protein BJX64DRAFT_299348 [Aspergillus heterothallicus]
MNPCNRLVHHPLGAASYYFKKCLIGYLNEQCTRPMIVLHVGAQPNCAPHIGNITTFATCFAVAAALQKQFGRVVRAQFTLVDTAPSPGHEFCINGVKYQKSVEESGRFEAMKTTFTKILDRLSQLSGVSYEVDGQSFWRSNPAFPSVVRCLVARREELGPRLVPETGRLAIRASCPVVGCGLADKHGVNNQYHGDGRITFICPDHGEWHLNVTSPDEISRLEFNTPLRNLIRILLCSRDSERSWIMCTGSEYAGFYQEQFMWRLLEQPHLAPIVFYAPLMIDWSGVKLSKSLYVNHDGYNYLIDAGGRYLLDSDTFLETQGGVEALLEEVQDWVDNPYRLFRSYTLEYLDMQLTARGMRRA